MLIWLAESILANLICAKLITRWEGTEESKKYLTINTHKGLYQYNRLVFGVTSCPAIWQRAIDQVLQGVPDTQCILDDMIITGKTDEEHLENLEKLLKRLQDAGLKANKEKCEFFRDRVQFCGHEIDSEGLHKTQEKIEAVVTGLQITVGHRTMADQNLPMSDKIATFVGHFVPPIFCCNI